MKRKSVPAILSVALGACVCVLCAVLFAGSGYALFMTSDTGSTQQFLARSTPNSLIAPALAPTQPLGKDAKPLNVMVKVEETLASSAVISATGGTLTAQAADGTKFTLTFPEGALLSDEKITLTPITAVDGLPFSGGLVGGVQMAPEGLRLLQPASLAIESPKTVAAKGFETVAFAYHQNGEGLYLNPSDAKGNVLLVEVWHFSGEGAAQGTPVEIERQQQQYAPSDCGDAGAQRMQEYLGRERQVQLLGQTADPELGKKIGGFLRQAYDGCIGPQLPTALEDCDAAPAILSKALAWLRQVQLLGYENDFRPESTTITETMEQALVNCYNKEYDQCVVDNDVKHRATMLGFLRQAALLGIEDRLDQSKIEKCPMLSYQASGQVGNGIWSGVVCRLDQPFTIMALPPDLEMPFRFVPTDSKSGNVSFDVSKFSVHWAGGGSYSVQGSGNEQARIVGQMTGTYTTDAGSGAYNVPLDIKLTPLGTTCNK